MKVKIKGIQGRRILWSVIKISTASAVMAAACWLCSLAFEQAFGESVLRRMLDVFVAVPVGVAVLYGASRLLGVEELEAAREAIRSRLLSRRAARRGAN